MLRGLFVTGTDTGVGKTAASAALMHRFRGRRGGGVRFWKPIQTGIEQDDDTAEVRRLGGCADDEVCEEGIRLTRPVSPHLAARLSNRSIALGPLTDFAAAQSATHRWIVEGAGGVLVPINDQDLMIDLMARLDLPVLVVARTTLGTINHTLLTIGALRARSLEVAGVLMVGEANAENRAAIETYGRVRVVGEMPWFEPLSAGALGQWASAHLDPDGVLG